MSMWKVCSIWEQTSVFLCTFVKKNCLRWNKSQMHIWGGVSLQSAGLWVSSLSQSSNETPELCPSPSPQSLSLFLQLCLMFFKAIWASVCRLSSVCLHAFYPSWTSDTSSVPISTSLYAILTCNKVQTHETVFPMQSCSFPFLQCFLQYFSMPFCSVHTWLIILLFPFNSLILCYHFINQLSPFPLCLILTGIWKPVWIFHLQSLYGI